MNRFLGLTKRNLLVFFKNKQMILFSLLSSIIILLLYILFLKGTILASINQSVDKYLTLNKSTLNQDIEIFVNLFLLTGIVGSAMITLPYSCLTTLIEDRENKIDYDIIATPVKRGQIILSYFVSAAISSIILTSIILTVGIIILNAKYNLYISIANLLASYGIVILGSISATAIFIIVALFIKSTEASRPFFGILSAVSGFVIGAYIPLSQFSKGVQYICNIFPATQITILLKNNLMNGILEHINKSLSGIDNGLFVKSIKEYLAFKANFFGYDLDIKMMIVYIAMIILICIIMQIIVYTKVYKKS